MFLCAWHLCAMYVKSSNNVQPNPKNIIISTSWLHFDHVSSLECFVYRAGNAPMIFLFPDEKAIHDTADCGLVFVIVDAPCAYVD